jgi:RND family efflux transporter MFP subunit
MSDERTSALHSLAIDRTETAGSRGGPGWLGLIIAIVISVLLGAGATWVWLGMQPEAPQPVAVESRDRQPPEGDGAAAAPRPAARGSGLVASGYVVARRQATVSAEITGRISEVLIEEGASVAQGEVLARLDDERARLDLDLLDAQLSASRQRVLALVAQRDEGDAQLARTRRLIESGFATDAALTAIQSQRNSLQAQLGAARADTDAAQARVASQIDFIDRHVVRAPFGGVVIAKNAQVGEILSPVSAGGGFTRTGIATIVDMDSLELEVDVNEGQIQRVFAGQQVEAILDAYPDWRIAARVEAIIPTADRARATIQVRVALNERDVRVLPDMAARVTFQDRE